MSWKLSASELEPRCVGADCDRDLCLIPSAATATALMAAVDPSTTATIDGTTLRCAIPCAALHDVLMGTKETSWTGRLTASQPV